MDSDGVPYLSVEAVSVCHNSVSPLDDKETSATHVVVYFLIISYIYTLLAITGLPEARSEISGPNFLVNFRTFLSVS